MVELVPPMVRVVVAARTNRVSPAQPVIVSDYLNGYSLGGDDGANGDGTLPLHFVRGFFMAPKLHRHSDQHQTNCQKWD